MSNRPLGLIEGQKALNNHRWLFSFSCFRSLRQKMTRMGNKTSMGVSDKSVPKLRVYSNMCAVTALPLALLSISLM
jgi:hypothetical protein